MKTLSKLTISALITVYGFISFTILSPLISTLTGNPIYLSTGLLFSLFFALATWISSQLITVQWKGIFSRLKEDEATKTWLLLHSFFTVTINKIYPLVAFISSFVPLFLVTYINSFPTNFMLSWALFLFSIIGLWSLHLIIGRGYRWPCKGTSMGIQSFSSFALQRLRNKDRKGIKYLLQALLLLKENLKHRALKLQELNNAIKTARCYLQFQAEIPYDSLRMLASELKRFPSFEHLPRTLSIFSYEPKAQWTIKFTSVEETKKPILQWIIILATVLAGLATFLPEIAKSTLLEILQSAGSAENIQIVIGLILLFVTSHISSLTRTYYLDPLEVRRFLLQKTHKTRPKA